MQHTQEARERLTLGFWLVLAGVAFCLVAMVLPIGRANGESASIIESFGPAVVIGFPVLASAALAFWNWNAGRGVAWPVAVVGVLGVFLGLAWWFGLQDEEGVDAGLGSLFLLAGGLLLFAGSVTLSVVLRRLRFSARVAAQVQQSTAGERMDAPAAALPPEGWYTDPRDANRSRWWDGARWTDATRHEAVQPASMAPPAA
jgi:hypothetical protein